MELHEEMNEDRQEEQEDPEVSEDGTQMSNANQWIRLKDNGGFVRRRIKPKVIRYRRYSLEYDPDNYYRELLMLYLPRRNEVTKLIDIDLQAKFTQHRSQILQNRKQFNSFEDTVLLTAMEEADRRALERKPEDEEDDMAPATCNEFNNFTLDEAENNDVDILEQMGEY